MKYRIFLFFIFFIQSFNMLSQVGVNNPTPAATLDVVGDVLIREKLYLENPGGYDADPTSNLLMINTSTDSVINYDLDSSSFGPLNYVQFAFMNTSSFGLDQGYNTKISAAKYTVAVHGYAFRRGDNTNVSLRSSTSSTYIEGHQFYAYVQGGEWHINAFVNNSRFYLGSSPTQVDLYLDLIVYRTNFITKVFDTAQVVDMSKAPTGDAVLPTGF